MSEITTKEDDVLDILTNLLKTKGAQVTSIGALFNPFKDDRADIYIQITKNPKETHLLENSNQTKRRQEKEAIEAEQAARKKADEERQKNFALLNKLEETLNIHPSLRYGARIKREIEEKERAAKAEKAKANIGRIAYPRDNSYAFNIATGNNERLAGTIGPRLSCQRQQVIILTEPFTFYYIGTPGARANMASYDPRPYPAVLVESLKDKSVHIVVNSFDFVTDEENTQACKPTYPNTFK